MRIGLIGCGLIGGSIGLACRANGHRVCAFEPDHASAELALKRGCADELGTLESVAACDVVFVSVPPQAATEILEKVRLAKSEGTVVTDCTSVKSSVVDWLKGSKDPNIVPGHPMAGHEKSGPQYASAWMFRGAKWILTPPSFASTSAVKKVESIVKEMGATPVRIKAEVHDRDVAVLSHLPHVLAAALLQQGAKLESIEASAGSWNDLTRVGGSDPNLWTQISMENRRELVKVLREFGQDLERFAVALEAGDGATVSDYFQKSKELKEKSS